MYPALTISSKILIFSILYDYVESPEWVFISMDHTTVNKYHDVDDKNKSFDASVYTLVMRRKALYPMTMLILPNLILAGLTILVFSVPIAAGKDTCWFIWISLMNCKNYKYAQRKSLPEFLLENVHKNFFFVILLSWS